jgi:murein DD-endopeptidase MepM/ murein hydrolase activator NlpD
VSWAAPIAGRGVVVVLHPDGRRTTYEPVDASVEVGEDVEPGEELGRLGAGSGHCGGVPSCLHWGLRRDDSYLDPLLLLRHGRPVLLP